MKVLFCFKQSVLFVFLLCQLSHVTNAMEDKNSGDIPSCIVFKNPHLWFDEGGNFGSDGNFRQAVLQKQQNHMQTKINSHLEFMYAQMIKRNCEYIVVKKNKDQSVDVTMQDYKAKKQRWNLRYSRACQRRLKSNGKQPSESFAASKLCFAGMISKKRFLEQKYNKESESHFFYNVGLLAFSLLSNIGSLDIDQNGLDMCAGISDLSY